MNVSVIIPTLNTPGLAAALEALRAQTALDHVVEILVAGQHTLTESDRFPRLVYVHVEDHPSAAHNRNAAARVATGDLLCFTDADCIPAPDWIEKILAANPANEAVAGAVKVPASIPYWGYADQLASFDQQAVETARQNLLEYAATLNFAIPRRMYLELGGIDESFKLFGEDREFCYRLRKAGYSIRYAPGAVVTHNHLRVDFRSAWRHQIDYGRATVQFRLRHYRDATLAWRLGIKLIRLPILGEILGTGRVLLRGSKKLVQAASAPAIAPYLPGMIVLDFAHTLGMIHGARTLAA